MIYDFELGSCDRDPRYTVFGEASDLNQWRKLVEVDARCLWLPVVLPGAHASQMREAHAKKVSADHAEEDVLEHAIVGPSKPGRFGNRA